MKLVFGNIQLTEEAYENLAREWRELGDKARSSDYQTGGLAGFESLATLLGIMPGIRRADERLQRRIAAKEAA